MPDLTGRYNPKVFIHQCKLWGFFYCRNISRTRESGCKGMINFRQAQCHSLMSEVLAPPNTFLILLTRSSEMNIAPVIKQSSQVYRSFQVNNHLEQQIKSGSQFIIEHLSASQIILVHHSASQCILMHLSHLSHLSSSQFILVHAQFPMYLRPPP